MSQQFPTVDGLAAVSVPTALVPLIEGLNEFFEQVGELPSGGDLEGLIEAHLSEMNRQLCERTLQRRQQALSDKASAQPEAFPPSGLSAMPAADAAGGSEAADDPDAPRPGALRPNGL